MYTLYISTAFIIAQWRKKFRFLVRLDNDYHHGAVISLDELAMQQRTTGEHSSSAPAWFDDDDGISPLASFPRRTYVMHAHLLCRRRGGARCGGAAPQCPLHYDWLNRFVSAVVPTFNANETKSISILHSTLPLKTRPSTACTVLKQRVISFYQFSFCVCLFNFDFGRSRQKNRHSREISFGKLHMEENSNATSKEIFIRNFIFQSSAEKSQQFSLIMLGSGFVYYIYNMEIFLVHECCTKKSAENSRGILL